MGFYNKTTAFLIIFFVFLTTICFAKPVEIDTAKKVALNFISERTTEQNYTISENLIISRQNENIFYIFNLKPQGFVIVSADDRAIPVLGYSRKGSYNNENQPPQFRAMLAAAGKDIISAIESNVSPSNKVQKQWFRLNKKPEDFKKIRTTDKVEPLIQSEWHQNSPYNELCPGGSKVGCVAIAMGQVMKYWSNPEHGKGSHSYWHSTYGHLSANFDTTYYQWQQIPHETSESNTPVATLLYHCGVSVNMNYSTTSSGATLDEDDGALHALETYFRYDTNAYYGTRTNYGDSLWQVMIRNEIDNFRPLIYGGWDPNGWTSGHAWNLDGYEYDEGDEQYYYHMNWGWGGSYNGYYALDDLTPGTSDYTLGQEAIFNIYPYAAIQVSCSPQNSNYWTGTTSSSAKTQTSLVHAQLPEDGWMMFDISALPDGAKIYGVILNGYVYDRYKPQWSITPVSSDPTSAAASVLHADIVAEQDSGYYFTNDETNVQGVEDWRYYMLEGGVEADFESSLTTDQFSLGIANYSTSSTKRIKFEGWNESNPPSLEVYYGSFGNLEGYVTEYGSKLALENVVINISTFCDTTDVNGYYNIETIPIGTYDVWADANNTTNSNGNPYFDSTTTAVSIQDSYTNQVDFSLKWAEIDPTPANITISVDPGEIVNEYITITNDGPGDLMYSSQIVPVDPSETNVALELDVSTPSEDPYCRGCEFDGTNIWVTGDYDNPNLYKLDTNGNLLATYSQDVDYSEMRGLVYHNSYLYGGAGSIFYRIDPNTGNVDSLFDDQENELGNFYTLAYVPYLGFLSKNDNNNFVVFDLTGTKLDTLKNPGEDYFQGMAYDDVNDCLWLFVKDGNPYMTRLYQYDIYQEKFTGFDYQLDLLSGLSSQTHGGICFTTDLINGEPTICGIVQGNPFDAFFAVQLENWLTITGNSHSSVPGYAKGSKDMDIQFDSEGMICTSKSANIVLMSNAGADDTVSVTMNNNYSDGTVQGYITEYGTKAPIPDATVTVGASYSDITDGNGYYQIDAIPLGKYEVAVTANNYLDSTITNIPVSGPPYELDVGLKWSEISVFPSSFTETVNPDFPVEKEMTITNNGPGELIYNCDIEFISGFTEPSILVIDRDLSGFGGGGPTAKGREEDNEDVWPYFQSALDANGYTYTYYEVTEPWIPEPDSTVMFAYDIIIWFSGETYGVDCLGVGDEMNLAAFLDNGGCLFLSSMGYLNVYSYGNYTFSDGEFPYDYLGVNEANMDNWDFGGTGSMSGVNNSIAQDMSFDIESIFNYSSFKIDEIVSHQGLDLFNMTSPSPEGICATQYDTGTYKTVFTSAPFSAITSASDRANLMNKIITYLSKSWMTITENSSGTVPGWSKGTIDVTIKLDATGVTESPVEANIVISNNANYSSSKGDDYSIPVTMIVDTTTAPPSPQNVSISISGDDIILSWDEVTGAGSYHISRSTNPYSGFSELPASPVSSTNFTDTDAAASSTKYFYYITADNAKQKYNFKNKRGLPRMENR